MLLRNQLSKLHSSLNIFKMAQFLALYRQLCFSFALPLFPLLTKYFVLLPHLEQNGRKKTPVGLGNDSTIFEIAG